eukprot:jgi/Botrbrau1/209/Bobra.0022s0189.1
MQCPPQTGLAGQGTVPSVQHTASQQGAYVASGYPMGPGSPGYPAGARGPVSQALGGVHSGGTQRLEGISGSDPVRSSQGLPSTAGWVYAGVAPGPPGTSAQHPPGAPAGQQVSMERLLAEQRSLQQQMQNQQLQRRQLLKEQQQQPQQQQHLQQQQRIILHQQQKAQEQALRQRQQQQQQHIQMMQARQHVLQQQQQRQQQQMQAYAAAAQAAAGRGSGAQPARPGGAPGGPAPAPVPATGGAAANTLAKIAAQANNQVVRGGGGGATPSASAPMSPLQQCPPTTADGARAAPSTLAEIAAQANQRVVRQDGGGGGQGGPPAAGPAAGAGGGAHPSRAPQGPSSAAAEMSAFREKAKQDMAAKATIQQSTAPPPAILQPLPPKPAFSVEGIAPQKQPSQQTRPYRPAREAPVSRVPGLPIAGRPRPALKNIPPLPIAGVAYTRRLLPTQLPQAPSTVPAAPIGRGQTVPRGPGPQSLGTRPPSPAVDKRTIMCIVCKQSKPLGEFMLYSSTGQYSQYCVPCWRGMQARQAANDAARREVQTGATQSRQRPSAYQGHASPQRGSYNPLMQYRAAQPATGRASGALVSHPHQGTQHPHQGTQHPRQGTQHPSTTSSPEVRQAPLHLAMGSRSGTAYPGLKQSPGPVSAVGPLGYPSHPPQQASYGAFPDKPNGAMPKHPVQGPGFREGAHAPAASPQGLRYSQEQLGARSTSLSAAYSGPQQGPAQQQPVPMEGEFIDLTGSGSPETSPLRHASVKAPTDNSPGGAFEQRPWPSVSSAPGGIPAHMYPPRVNVGPAGSLSGVAGRPRGRQRLGWVPRCLQPLGRASFRGGLSYLLLEYRLYRKLRHHMRKRGSVPWWLGRDLTRPCLPWNRIPCSLGRNPVPPCLLWNRTVWRKPNQASTLFFPSLVRLHTHVLAGRRDVLSLGDPGQVIPGDWAGKMSCSQPHMSL